MSSFFTKSCRILLLGESASFCEKWSEAMALEGLSVVANEISPSDTSELPDLVVRQAGNMNFESDSALPEVMIQRIGQRIIGLIVVGESEGNYNSDRAVHQDAVTPDLIFPSSVEPAQLIMACRLLAEIIRLRREISRQRTVQHHLTRLASLDALTEIPNRRAWQEEIQRRVSLLEDGIDRPFCMALFDVDHFKQINDERGHLAGDQALKAVGLTLLRSVRQDDLCARLGGDEFVVILSYFDEKQIEPVVDRIRRQMGAAINESSDLESTVSVGFVVVESLGKKIDPQQIYAKADKALRAAKENGRDRAELAPPEE